MNGRFIDLSHGLHSVTPVFTGYPTVKISVLDSTKQSTEAERHLNSSSMAIGLHCGTHMDAPFHFITHGRTIDQIALDQCIGPALLIHLNSVDVEGQIQLADCTPYEKQLCQTGKVILNTGWHQRWDDPTYFTNYPIITDAAASFFVDCGVHLVGVDTPSVDRPPFGAHLSLLGNDVVILENLTNLDSIRSDIFQLIAIPLKVCGREACPVRAIALES